LDKAIYKMVSEGMLNCFDVEIKVGNKTIVSKTKFDGTSNNYLTWEDNTTSLLNGYNTIF
jgi:hypothetical protein